MLAKLGIFQNLVNQFYKMTKKITNPQTQNI